MRFHKNQQERTFRRQGLLHRSLVLILAMAASLQIPAFALSPVASLLEQNRLKEAIPLCRQIEVLSSYSQDELAACSWVYYRTNNMESGDALKSKLMTKNSVDHQLLTAFAHMKRQQWEQASSILTALEKQHEGTATALSAQQLQAETYEMRGNLPAAAFIYKGIITTDPTRARAHWGMARFYLNRGEQQRAIKHMETVAKLWPKHIPSRFNMGILYMAQGNNKLAGEWLAECYHLDKGDPGVLEQLGVLFEKKGRLADAVKYWQRAYDIDKSSTQLAKKKLSKHYSKLIDEAMLDQQWERALKYIASAEAVSPKNAKMEMLCRRGIILSNTAASEIDPARLKTEFARAAGELKACLSQQEDNVWAIRQLGVCYVNLNLIKEAQGFFLRATRLEPKNGMNFAWLGFVEAKLGMVCESLAHYRQAIPLLENPEEISKAVRRVASVQEKAQGKCPTQ